MWEHRTDLNGYSEISQDMYDCITQHIQHGISEDEIIKKIVRESRLSPDLILFIIKNSKNDS